MRREKCLVGLVFVLMLLPVVLASVQVPGGTVENEVAAALNPAPEWSVPEEKQIRVIIDSDAANEADDQAVIAYALLSPALVIRGLVAAHFTIHSASSVQSAEESMEASYREMQEILRIMKLAGCIPLRKGAARPLVSATEPVHSEGADFIIEEALRDDPRPLYVVFLGPATDLAAAYLKRPEIAERLTAVWIGGMGYPEGGQCYNLMGDPIAANVVMESKIPLWQIPMPVYSRGRFAIAEAAEKVGRQGKLGAFLFDRLRRFVTVFPPVREFFQYADLPAIGILLAPWRGDFETRPAPSITLGGYYVHNQKNRPIRVYRSYDQRAVLEDFFAKLAAYARGDLRPRCNEGEAVQQEQ